jgi:hypothetical protein
MSARNDRPPRRRPTRTRRASRTTEHSNADSTADHSSDTAGARAHFHREKAARAGRVRTADHPLEQARRAYEALLAKDAERARGGRPKKAKQK